MDKSTLENNPLLVKLGKGHKIPYLPRTPS